MAQGYVHTRLGVFTVCHDKIAGELGKSTRVGNQMGDLDIANSLTPPIPAAPNCGEHDAKASKQATVMNDCFMIEGKGRERKSMVTCQHYSKTDRGKEKDRR